MPDTTASPDAAAPGAPTPYDATPTQQPMVQPYGLFGGGGDPNSTGLLGMSFGTGAGLANFGANMITSANARTSFGTLANPGILGAFGAGLQATEAQGRAAAQQYADIQAKNAATLGEQLRNRVAQANYPSDVQQAKYMQEYWRQILERQQQQGQQQQGQQTSSTQPPDNTPKVGGPFVAKDLPAWVTPDEDAVVRTVWGESRGEGPEGQQAVASVIANRAAATGTSRSDVVYAPGQFQPWNDAKTRPALEKLDPNSPEYQQIFTNIQPILAGTGKDVTNGSTYFYSPTAQAALGRDTPAWAVDQQPTVTIGRHQFYKLPFGANTDVAGKAPPAPAPAPTTQATSQPAPAPPASLPPGAPPPQPPPASLPPGAPPPQPAPGATTGMRTPGTTFATTGSPTQTLPFKPYQIAGPMQPPPQSSLPPSPNVQQVGDYGGPGTQRPVAQAQPPTQLGRPAPQPTPTTQPPAARPAPGANDTITAANAIDAQVSQLNSTAARTEQLQAAWKNQADFLAARHAPMMEPYPAGDPAAMRQQALTLAAKSAELRASVPLAVAKAAHENVEMRPDGTTRMTNADGTETIVRAPHYTEQTLGEETTIGGVVYPAGTKIGGYTNQPPLGSPPGTQGQFVPSIDQSTGKPLVIGLAPQVQASRTKANEDFTGPDSDNYIAAQNQKGLYTQLQDAAQVLHDHGGFVGMGPTAPERIGFLAKINDAIRSVGGTPVEASVVGAWEEMSKATGQLGFETAAKYEGHARTAAQTIMNATQINPSAMNSEAGFRRVLAGVQESAQAVTDLHEYEADIYRRGGDLSTAPVDFYTKNSPRMYGMRAISTMKAYDISDKSEVTKYLPGTFVKYQGNIFQIPDRSGAPATPDYLKGAPPPQAQDTQSAPVAASPPVAIPPGSGMGP